MKIERDVKEQMKLVFKQMKAWWFMYVPVGYGKSGVPDFIACVPVTITPDMVGKTYGFFFAPEAKFGREKPSEMQKVQMSLIAEAKGVSFVVNEKTVAEMEHQFRQCL